MRVTLRREATTDGPIVRLGTKWPSMMSTWRTVAHVFAPICRSERDAGDNLIQIVTIQSPPQALLFVNDQEMTGGTFIESLYRVRVPGFFTEELGGKRIDKRRKRFPFQDGLAD